MHDVVPNRSTSKMSGKCAKPRFVYRCIVHDNRGQLERSMEGTAEDLRSGGVRTPHLAMSISEWARGRHKPAIHEMLCTELMIKPQCVGSATKKKQRRTAAKTSKQVYFTQARSQNGSPNDRG